MYEVRTEVAVSMAVDVTVSFSVSEIVEVMLSMLVDVTVATIVEVSVIVAVVDISDTSLMGTPAHRDSIFWCAPWMLELRACSAVLVAMNWLTADEMDACAAPMADAIDAFTLTDAVFSVATSKLAAAIDPAKRGKISRIFIGTRSGTRSSCTRCRLLLFFKGLLSFTGPANQNHGKMKSVSTCTTPK